LFHNSNVFGSCFIHILYTGCAKIKKNNSGAKRLIVREFLARISIIVLEHPPYWPDLAPCDFFLFPKCNLVLWGRHLGGVTTIKSEMTLLLKGLTF